MEGKTFGSLLSMNVMCSKPCPPGNWKRGSKSHASCTTRILPSFAFELNFEVADESQVMPVIELPTKTRRSCSRFRQPDPTVEGFSIVLESETPLEDGYILSGSYQWTDPRFDASLHHTSVK